MINISKIKNDKYYTSSELAKYIVNKTKEIIGEENINEYLEPSAGYGVFLDYLPKGTLAYDIEPKDDKGRIVKQDFLELDLDYKKGRCIIGNPPYGTKNKLYLQFYKKSIKLADYISFILPISQLNNNYEMYDFDLIHSEDLGIKEYSDRKVHCCFNIYKRPLNDKLNKRQNYKFKDVILKGVSRGTARNDKVPNKYDFSICGFGSIGKLCEYEGQYCQQIYVTINNNKYKDKIKDIILNADWYKLYDMTATPKLKHWQIYKYIKEQIPEIK